MSTVVLGVLLVGLAAASPVYHVVHGRRARLLLSALGVAALGAMYGVDALHLVAMWACCCAVQRVLPVHVAPHAFLALAMTHLTAAQVHRYRHEYLCYSLDWSLSGMLLALRLADALWARRDGAAVHRGVPLSRTQRAEAVDRALSPLELFGFAFFFPGVLVGPFRDVRQYLDFINYEGVYAALAPVKDGEEKKQRVTLAMLARSRSFLSRVWMPPVTLASFMLAGRFVPEDAMYTDEFRAQHGFWFRALYAFLATEAGHSKYYFTWSCGELGTILSGLSFDGFKSDGSLRWFVISPLVPLVHCSVYHFIFGCTQTQTARDVCSCSCASSSRSLTQRI